MTLTIKTGDWAVLRNGEIRGPISIDNDEEKYPLVTSSESWTAKGEWLHENDFTRFGGHVDRDIITTLPCSPLERIRQLEEALRFYANPEVYKPHPHGPAFDRRDISETARRALEAKP